MRSAHTLSVFSGMLSDTFLGYSRLKGVIPEIERTGSRLSFFFVGCPVRFVSRIEQPNLRKQFVRTKRLEQTCLKTGFVYAICLFDQASDSDDWNTASLVRPKFANLTQQLETIYSVHQNVSNHHMRTFVLYCLESLDRKRHV